MIKGLLHGALFILSLLILTACPYSSKVPLGNSDNSIIEKKVVGLWDFDHNVQTGDIENSPHKLLIKKFNDKEYLIEIMSMDFGGGNNDYELKISRFRGYSVKVGDVSIMNIQPLDDNKEANFLFYKYEVVGRTELRITELSTEFSDEKFESTTLLKKKLIANINDKNIWGTTSIYKLKK